MRLKCLIIFAITKVNTAGNTYKNISATELTKNSFAGNDTNITIDQVYNKISINYKRKSFILLNYLI